MTTNVQTEPTYYTMPGVVNADGSLVQMSAEQFANMQAIMGNQDGTPPQATPAAPAPTPAPTPTPDASFTPYTPGVTPAIPDASSIQMPEGFDDEFDELLNADWEVAEVSAPRSFEDLPAGKYVAYIRSAVASTFEQGDNTGKKKIVLTLRVMESNHRGVSQTKFYGLTDLKKVGFFKSDIVTMGVDLAGIGMNPAQFVNNGLHVLLNRVIAITVTHKPNPEGGEYVNLYIDRVVNGKPIPEDLLAMDAANQWGPAGGATANAFTTPPPARGGAMPSL